MKKILSIIFILVSFISVINSLTIEEMKENSVAINTEQVNNKIEVAWSYKDNTICDSTIVYRNYNQMEIPIDLYRLPIRRNLVISDTMFVDSKVASNISYYYMIVGYLNGEAWAVSNNSKVNIESDSLAVSQYTYKDIHIAIDKKNYLLKIKAKNKTLKTYPMVMGENPFSRKIMRDWVSSPEGVYSVVYIQRLATYYKALDVNYPNTIDRVRYEVAKQHDKLLPNAEIGGSVQIHGMGINTNWTAGSFGLRNDDIDEILASKLVKRGSKILITGYEVSEEDIKFIDRFWTKSEIKVIQKKLRDSGYPLGMDGVLGPNSRRILGQYQFDKGLKLTCSLDKATCESIGYIPYNLKP